MSLNANAKSGAGCLDDAGKLRIPPTDRKQRGAGFALLPEISRKSGFVKKSVEVM
jgi:hypothetical protein